MPKFTIKLLVVNYNSVSVKAHVGASLVGVTDHKEFFNKAEDITILFKPGKSVIGRYLTTDLGAYQKYNLHVALWEAEKPIGHGIKYIAIMRKNVVEKKKRPIKLGIAITYFAPPSFEK